MRQKRLGAQDRGPGLVADVETARAELIAHGVQASGVDVQPWSSFVTFSDPEGNSWRCSSCPPAHSPSRTSEGVKARSAADEGPALPSLSARGHARGVIPGEPGVVIKPHHGGLVFVVAWIGFLCLLMVLSSIGERSARGLFLVFVWLPWLVPVALAARSRVIAVGDTLTYRSPLRTRTWRRAEVENFEIASGRWSSRVRLIQMHAADGEWVPFAITARSWPRNTARVGLWYAALEGWRLGDSQPARD